MTNTELFDLWRARAVEDPDLLTELDGIRGDADAINDRFYRDLAFGTGGLRGVIGAGSNRMNIYTIRRATQGLADYINAAGLPKKVAIGHDSRHKGELFSREAARVLAANGITAYLYPRLEPTPALSWAVRYLGCGAGICVTASHNPAKYNGYKVYGADGCQITLETADAVSKHIGAADHFDGVRLCGFADALSLKSKIDALWAEYLAEFPDDVDALVLNGKFLRATGDDELSYKQFSHADALSPNLPVVKQQLANYEAEHGLAKHAYDNIRAAVSLAPENSACTSQKTDCA